MYFLKKLVWLYAVHPWLIWREKGWQLNYEVTKDTVMNVGNVSVWQSFPVTIHPEIQTCASGHCQAERGGKEIGSDQSCRFVLCWQQSVRSSGLSHRLCTGWGEWGTARDTEILQNWRWAHAGSRGSGDSLGLDHLFPQLNVGCPRGRFFSTLPSPNIKLIGCMFQKRSLSALGTQSLILPQGYLQQSWLSAGGSLPCR